MIIASFVDSDDMTSTNGFGLMLSQQFSTQLVDSDYHVVELLLRENIYITDRCYAAAIEPPFLWILSFGGAKESISPSGAITRLIHRLDSDLIICFFINR